MEDRPLLRERHVCHALGCDKPVLRRMFMCKPHWYKLTKDERERVWALYVPGQENDWSLVTSEYLNATMAIIQALAEREGVRAE